MKFVRVFVLFALPAVTVAAPARQPALVSGYAVTGAFLSTNLSAAVVKLNHNFGIASGAVFGASGSKPPLRAAPADTCVFGNCGGTPVPVGPCTGSPENPTALLAVLGISGLLLGRLGFRQLRGQPVAAAA